MKLDSYLVSKGIECKGYNLDTSSIAYSAIQQNPLIEVDEVKVFIARDAIQRVYEVEHEVISWLYSNSFRLVGSVVLVLC